MLLKLKCMNTGFFLVSHYVPFPKKERKKWEIFITLLKTFCNFCTPSLFLCCEWGQIRWVVIQCDGVISETLCEFFSVNKVYALLWIKVDSIFICTYRAKLTISHLLATVFFFFFFRFTFFHVFHVVKIDRIEALGC